MTIGFENSYVPEPLKLSIIDKSDGKFIRGGKLVGRVYESDSHDENFYVAFRRKSDSQFHRNRNSYAIDTSIIQTAKEKWDVGKIAIFVLDSGNVLVFDIDSYIEAEEANEGHGDQLFPEQSEANLLYKQVFNIDKRKWYPEVIEFE